MGKCARAIRLVKREIRKWISTPTPGARIEAGLHNKVAAFRQGPPPPPSHHE